MSSPTKSSPTNSTRPASSQPYPQARRPSVPPKGPTSPRVFATAPLAGSHTDAEVSSSTPTQSTFLSQEILDRRRTSKARDLLRKHYGMGIGPPTPTGNPNDPMDLDSPGFNAKAYYEQLITTSSLSALLKRENELLSDIRELDSERQSLVYNHHQELIAASDTIGTMKSRAESLETDLEKLKSVFSEISRLSVQLSSEHTITPSDSSRLQETQ